MLNGIPRIWVFMQKVIHLNSSKPITLPCRPATAEHVEVAALFTGPGLVFVSNYAAWFSPRLSRFCESVSVSVCHESQARITWM